MQADLARIQQSLRLAAEAAGRAAMPHFREGEKTSARISYKEFGSPVTEADLAADAAIRKVLQALHPDIPIFSEEVEDSAARLDTSRVFVVDPIDGTRAFIAGGSEWCVSIALMEHNHPVVGVIFAPVRNEMFEARRGGGAFLNGASLPIANTAPGVISGPMPMIDQLLARHCNFVAGPRMRSLAYRLVSVTTGTVEAALASCGARDWDIAAAAVILAECDIALLTFSAEEPVYNAVDPVHPALVAAPDALALSLLSCFGQNAS